VGRELIIAIDGPSGAGKSTLSKALAENLGYLQINTGAMYRCVALAAARNNIDLDDGAALGSLAASLSIRFERDGGDERVLLDGEDVSEAIRTPENSLRTSRVSAHLAVRQAMLEQQRRLGREGGVVLEGRDIGTVVFPEAQVKFFLDATAAERGRRRWLELKEKGLEVDLQQTITEVETRDAADSAREHAPLSRAEDAVTIDATALGVDEVLALMLITVQQRRNGSRGLSGGEK